MALAAIRYMAVIMSLFINGSCCSICMFFVLVHLWSQSCDLPSEAIILLGKLYFNCYVAVCVLCLSHGVIGRNVVCECGSSWSYALYVLILSIN